MKLSQPSATQLVYQSYSYSWIAVLFLGMPIAAVNFVFQAINYLSILQSDISNIDAWLSALFRLSWSIPVLIVTFFVIKRKILIIDRTAIFDKDLYKLTLKTTTILGHEVLEYSFDMIADVIVDGDTNKQSLTVGFRSKYSAADGLSCIAIKLINGDIINLDGWYSSGGFDKKEKIVEQIRAFLNLSEKLDKKSK